MSRTAYLVLGLRVCATTAQWYLQLLIGPKNRFHTGVKPVKRHLVYFSLHDDLGFSQPRCVR